MNELSVKHSPDGLTWAEGKGVVLCEASGCRAYTTHPEPEKTGWANAATSWGEWYCPKHAAALPIDYVTCGACEHVAIGSDLAHHPIRRYGVCNICSGPTMLDPNSQCERCGKQLGAINHIVCVGDVRIGGTWACEGCTEMNDGKRRLKAMPGHAPIADEASDAAMDDAVTDKQQIGPDSLTCDECDYTCDRGDVGYARLRDSGSRAACERAMDAACERAMDAACERVMEMGEQGPIADEAPDAAMDAAVATLDARRAARLWPVLQRSANELHGAYIEHKRDVVAAYERLHGPDAWARTSTGRCASDYVGHRCICADCEARAKDNCYWALCDRGCPGPVDGCRAGRAEGDRT